MKSRRSWWLIFTACAIALVAALGWISIEMLRLEGAESRARAAAEYQEAQRLALWRMDSWFAPLLARESARPYFEYLPYYAQGRAYTRILNRIEPGEVLTPSPLLAFDSPYFQLHFQVSADGALISPQVPTGNLRDLAEATGVDAARLAAKEALLGRLRLLLEEGPGLDAAILAAEARTGMLLALGPADDEPPIPRQAQAATKLSSSAEAQRRAQSYNIAQTAQTELECLTGPPGSPDADAVEIGPFAPLWLREIGVECPALGAGPAECVMVVARRVRVGDDVHHQGILIGWPPLRDDLLAQVGDLFPEAGLRAVPDGIDAAEWATRSLASLPVALAVAAPAAPTGAAGLTPTRLVLVVAWGLLLLAIGAAAITLRSIIAFGERRSRFASAVTHELRTPLTTFRLYAEMLDEGMVRDEDQRKRYVRTLRDESDRLGHLVENVLAYSRLESGRARFSPTATTLGDLAERLRPGLERCAAAAGMAIDVRTNGATDHDLCLDADAVGQIVENLVENAGKYAREAADPTIHVDATVTNGRLRIDVRDHGPGVPPEHRRTIFTPFERGARQHEGGTPGVGLGLAIARGLARRLGGDLTLEDDGAPGARFRLEVPSGS